MLEVQFCDRLVSEDSVVSSPYIDLVSVLLLMPAESTLRKARFTVGRIVPSHRAALPCREDTIFAAQRGTAHNSHSC